MRIRPARLAAVLLGKRLSPPFVGLNTLTTLRLLRLSGAPIEGLYEVISEAKGSTLWLEDFLEEAEKNTPSIINKLITILVFKEGMFFWKSEESSRHPTTTQEIIESLQEAILESGQRFSDLIVNLDTGESVSMSFYTNTGSGTQNNARDFSQQGGANATQNQENYNKFSSGFDTSYLDIRRAIEDMFSQQEKIADNLLKEELSFLRKEITELRSGEEKKGFVTRLASFLNHLSKITDSATEIYDTIKRTASLCIPLLQASMNTELSHLLENLST